MLSEFLDHAALADYYSRLQAVKAQGFKNESQTQRAFSYLLTALAEDRKWTFVAETPLDGPGKGRTVDGSIRDELRITRGHWEAKDEKDDLNAEIVWKRAIGYPTDNIIFEDTRQAVLWQNKREVGQFDLTRRPELAELLQRFFEHTDEDRVGFADAVRDFAPRIPDLARALQEIIGAEYERNPKYKRALDSFFTLCQGALNPQIKREAVEELLIQHLLTERLFRTVFRRPEWVQNNPIAGEIERVIAALTSRNFSRDAFLSRLDPFYKAIEDTGRTIELWSDKQAFLNTVYERFFQGYSTETADTMGIVYTPQPIANWMCASVDKVLSSEWGKSFSTQGVHVLDPCTGTGNFLVNVMGRVSSLDLERKYRAELFANEIMLLPYYIAAGNIEHEYFERMGEYAEFEGLCFADTLDLFKGAQMTMFAEGNSERVAREMDAPITVIIGNPPYNVGQKNENDNNKNRPYPRLDKEISQTWAKASKATNKNGYGNPYVRFLKWATERLNGQDGVICFVTDNSFVDAHMFDGIRHCLPDEFNHIWHLDLHGNVRENPKLSGTTHNVFGIQVGVGITILARNSKSNERFIRYHRVPEFWRRIEKLEWLTKAVDLDGVEWQELQPNAKSTWLTAGLQEDFETFAPLGTKDAKASFSANIQTIFRSFSNGVKTNRDEWVYDFNRATLIEDVQRFIGVYNGELERWRASDQKTALDDFVSYDTIKWSRDLKLDLKRGHNASFDEKNIRPALYRPFAKQWLYFDRLMNEEVYTQPKYFATPETNNRVIALTDVAGDKPFMVLMTDCIPDLHLVGAGASCQCFPLYTFTPDGEMQSENVTPWAVEQFGGALSREQIFYATYALLHHPAYRARYVGNLKRELPRIPTTLLDGRELARIGRALGDLHVGFESAPELESLKIIEAKREKGVKVSFRVEKMKWSKDKTQLIVNPHFTLSGFTPEIFAYQLGSRSALDWIVESFRFKEEVRSGLESDPNRADDPQYILRLVRRIAGVALETQRLIQQLPPWPATEASSDPDDL